MYTLHMCTGQDISVHDRLKGGVTASDSGKEWVFFFFFAFLLKTSLGAHRAFKQWVRLRMFGAVCMYPDMASCLIRRKNNFIITT